MKTFDLRSSHVGGSTKYDLWVTVQDKPYVICAQGTREELESSEVQEKAIAKAERYWKREAAEEKALAECNAKWPKKTCGILGNEIEVYNKNGNLFKTIKIEY